MDGGEFVYGSDQEYDNIDASSEPVQGLATSVYKEFERMIAKYDQDVVRDLMPLVVTMLETLDQAITEKNESAVEIELLEDDKNQLKSQFERERQMKRHAEQRLIESDDSAESLARDLKETTEKLEVATRQYEMKCRSNTDQMERLLEREAELKKEYNELHQRHSEMIRSYVEHIEKTKALQQQHTPEVAPYSPVMHKKRPIILESVSPLSPETPSFKPIDSTPTQDSFDDVDVGKVRRPEWPRPVDPYQPNLKQEIAETKNKDDDSRGESVVSSSKEENHIDIYSDGTSLESVSSGPDSGHILTHEFQQNVLKLGLPIETSTPNHHVEQEDEVTFTKNEIIDRDYGIENEGFEHAVITNNNSLFAELDGKDLGDVDDGADLLGMGKELENLMLENTKLMATKNALDIVKDDLIHQVDQLTNQLTMLQEDLDRAHHSKDFLSKRAHELEMQLRNAEKKAREAVESPSSQTSKTPDEDDAVPMSQRKRFTRVEMARVLMERNQYKERLMELQEAVRWTEMLRASRDHPAEEELIPGTKTKNRSSLSQFFSRLFGPSNNSNPSNVSPSRSRRRMNPNQQADDIKMRHSKSDSFTAGQSASGK